MLFSSSSIVEEQKIAFHPSNLQNFLLNQTYTWLWDRSPNPWITKPQFIAYSDLDCLILSEQYKYFDQAPKHQKVNHALCHLGDYTVDFSKMIQFRSDNPSLERKVRCLPLSHRANRSTYDRFSQPLFLNSSFLDTKKQFDSKSNRFRFVGKWFKLKQGMKYQGLDNKEYYAPTLDLIISGIIEQQRKHINPNCPRLQQLLEKSITMWKKIFKQSNLTNQKILQLFIHAYDNDRHYDKNLVDTANSVLFIYTMETFLYRYLNNVMRNDDSTKIKTLGPFATLLHFSVSLFWRDPRRWQGKYVKTKNGRKYIKFYRGANISDQDLDNYYQAFKNKGQSQYDIKFPCFTSFTLDKLTALGYANAGEQNPVLFQLCSYQQKKGAQNEFFIGLLDKKKSAFCHEQEFLFIQNYYNQYIITDIRKKGKVNVIELVSFLKID